MAVGEFVEATLHPVSGVKIGVAEAGIRYQNRKDVVVFQFVLEPQALVCSLKIVFVQRLCNFASNI